MSLGLLALTGYSFFSLSTASGKKHIFGKSGQKSKINSWSRIMLKKLPRFIFGGLPNQSRHIDNIEEAKNTENDFTDFRKICTTEVGWNK